MTSWFDRNSTFYCFIRLLKGWEFWFSEQKCRKTIKSRFSVKSQCDILDWLTQHLDHQNCPDVNNERLWKTVKLGKCWVYATKICRYLVHLALWFWYCTDWSFQCRTAKYIPKRVDVLFQGGKDHPHIMSAHF